MRRLRKALRRSLPAYFDIYQWLRDRRYADTTGQARAIVMDKRLRSESHVVGLVTVHDPQTQKPVTVVERLQPVGIRETLRVEPA